MKKAEGNILLEQQMRHELETWQRTLNFILQENIHLKTRLAELIREGMDDELLEQVEYFQNQFLNKDAVINLLRRDMAREAELNGAFLSKENLAHHEKLRKDVEMMEKEFNRLKFDFNNYLFQNLG